MASKRSGEIDLFRFVFAMIVLLYHFNSSYEQNIFDNGIVSAEFFFVLSGFLIAKQTKRHKDESLSLDRTATLTWTYMKKKFASIYAYYLLAIVLQFVIRFAVLEGLGIAELFEKLVQGIPVLTLSFAALVPISDAALYIGNTWFLSALLVASFLLYPLLIKRHGFATKIICPILALFGLAYLYATYNRVDVWMQWNGTVYVSLIRAVCVMALGAFLVPLSDALMENHPSFFASNEFGKKLFLTLLKAFCYGASIFYSYYSPLDNRYSLSALLFVSFGMMLSFMNAGWCVGDCKFTRFIGKLSLPIYIFHGLIRRIIEHLVPMENIDTWVFVLMIVITISLCATLMFLVDCALDGFRELKKNKSQS